MNTKTNLKSWAVVSVLLLGIQYAIASGAVIYVDADAPPAGNGQTWRTAYNYLQDALAEANSSPDVNQIWLAAGSYYPDANTSYPAGTDDREATFQLISGVAIYGGFAGDETSLTERDWEANETILSGDINTPADNNDNSYHVVTGSGTEPNTILDGFIIIAGNANDPCLPTIYCYGGGMYNDSGSPTVANCIFKENSASKSGGGIYCIDSSPTIINCTISDNTAYEGSGGGIYVGSTSSRELLGSTIQPSMAPPGGCGGDPITTIKNSNISNNSSAVNGGGISSNGSSLVVAESTVSLNTAVGLGGGIYFEGSDSDLGPGPNLSLSNDENMNNMAGSGGGLAIFKDESESSSYNFLEDYPDLNPQIVEDSGGTLHVVWESDKFLSGSGPHSDIFGSSNNGGGWSDRAMVNQSNASADWNPQIIEDSNTLYAVWSSKEDLNGAGTDFDIFFATNSGSGWSVPELVNTYGTGDSDWDLNPQIVKDSSDRLHVVWHGRGDTGPSGTDFDIFYASKTGGGGWSAPSLLNINGNSDTLYDGFAQIIAGNFGTLHAVWHSAENLNGEAGMDYDIFYSYNSGGGWSYPSLLNTNGTTDTGDDGYPQIMEDSSGRLHSVWHSNENLNGAADIDYDIFYASNNGGGWSAPSLLNINGNGDSGADGDAQIIEDSNGTLCAVWESNEDLSGAGTDYDIFCATNNGIGWSYPSLLNANGASDSGDDYLPQIIEDSSGGTFHVVWESNEDLNGAGTDYDIFYAYGSCGDWSCPRQVNHMPTISIIAIKFTGNYASNNGGAIYIEDSNTPFSNCIFSGNNANGYGGAIYCYDSVAAEFQNCTMGNNKASGGAGGAMANCSNSSPTLTNCILWGNSAPSEPEIYNDATSSATVSYCDVQGGWLGLGNIDADPCFADACNGDYHLQSQAGRWDLNRESWVVDANTSRCIDAGNPGLPLGDERSDANNVRVNIGACGGTAEASKTPSHWSLLSDLNNNGIVGMEDVGVQAEDWLISRSRQAGDLDRNEIVNLLDFGLLAQDYLEQTNWYAP